MKFVFYGLMVIGAFFLGQAMYPSLKPTLLPVKGEEAADGVKRITVKTPYGNVVEEVDLGNLKEEDFPEKVKVLGEVILTNERGLEAVVLDVGSSVRPLRIEGEDLVVTSPLAQSLEGAIGLDKTTLAEEVAKKRVAARQKLVQETQGFAKVPENQPKPQPEPKPEPQVAQVEPEAVPEPVMEEPAPKPEPEPEGPKVLTDEQIVAAMQEHLKGGTIQEFNFEQVQGWKASEREMFDGEEYQVGLAAYEEETILGKKILQAKALFQDGELEKWVYAQTGMEIK
ncbi:MAG: hypothetical protein AAGC74_05470 [Verrucomicrobiota bacterium]